MIKKVKITHVARYAKPYIGGIEAVIEQINNSLPDEKFEKEVYCCSNIDTSSIENNVKYHRCKYLFNFAANSISPQLFFEMLGLKTDIIHFHMPVIQNVVIWFILYILGLIKYKKMIITYHGSITGYDIYMKPFWGLYRFFFKKADKIHVLSPNIIDSDEILIKNKEKCIIIPFGLNVDIEPTIETPINGYNIENIAKGRKKILCMGRIVDWKGFNNIIEAMKELNNCVLFIAGNGTCFDKYKQYIKDNNLLEKVILLGNVVNQKEKNYLFSYIDIFVLPSERKSESFGIVQLEAMKYSKPIINTNLGTGVNYVSINAQTGLTIEPKNVKQLVNAINKLLNNDNLRLMYGRNARERFINLFDIEKIKKQYLELYEEKI